MKLKNMIKTAVLSGLLFFASTGFAADNWVGSIKIGGLATYADGTVNFVVVGEPIGTCNYWGFRFTLDAKTIGGRNMLATLITAKATDKSVDLAYTRTTAPEGSNQDNGCTQLNMARVWGVTIQ